jgi:hypothetical protein
VRETPTISNTAYTSTTNSAADFMLGVQGAASGQKFFVVQQPTQPHSLPEPEPMTTRIVKVFVADPDDSLPLESRVLYQGEEKLTDLTDQELFFELPIQDLMTKHNAIRIKTRDKEQSNSFGRDIMLEPIKVRDLKMVIVNVAALG